MCKTVLLCMSVISGLFCGCYDGETECFGSSQFVSLNFLTTGKLDSVHFYLNEDRVCEGNIGVYYDQILCYQDSNAFLTAMIATESDTDKCILSDEKSIWKAVHCFVGKPSDGVNVGSAKIWLRIFYKNESSRVELPLESFGGSNVNIIAEHDTISWFAYDENPIRPYFDDYESPAASNRVGCHDGYCIATLPMADKDVCYDK